MANSLAQKLKIKENYTLLTIHAPADFTKTLEPAPKGLQVSGKAKEYQQLHWFVSNKKQLDEELKKVLPLIKKDVLCWIYYPKSSSKIQSDLTRDKGWENFLKHEELLWISLISFDETWSTFSCRLKTESDLKKDSRAKEREIFNYIDPAKKVVRLPEDFSAVLNRNKKALAYFNTLSFSNRKEYVEWIITAKREETRSERINGSIDRLNKQWKNPRNI
jgi:hypothetical protein